MTTGDETSSGPRRSVVGRGLVAATGRALQGGRENARPLTGFAPVGNLAESGSFVSAGLDFSGALMTRGRAVHTDDRKPLGGVPDAAQWLDSHGDALYRYALARVRRRERAEDLVQETFLAALQAWERFDGRSSVRTWLLAILRRKIVDGYREAARKREAGAEAGRTAEGIDPARLFQDDGHWRRGVSRWKSAAEALEDREFWDVFDGCVARMPSALASVFVLRELEGMAFEDLGRVLSLSAGNLRVRLHRARLSLRECLETHWFRGDRQEPGRPP